MCESYVLCFQVHRKNMNDWWNPLKTKPFQSFESFAHGRLARADCRVLHSLWLAKFVSWWCTYCCIIASARYTQMCTLTVHIVFVCNESVQICVYCRTRHCMDKCLADVHFCTLYGLLTRNIITSVVFSTFMYNGSNILPQPKAALKIPKIISTAQRCSSSQVVQSQTPHWHLGLIVLICSKLWLNALK